MGSTKYTLPNPGHSLTTDAMRRWARAHSVYGKTVRLLLAHVLATTMATTRSFAAVSRLAAYISEIVGKRDEYDNIGCAEANVTRLSRMGPVDSTEEARHAHIWRGHAPPPTQEHGNSGSFSNRYGLRRMTGVCDLRDVL